MPLPRTESASLSFTQDPDQSQLSRSGARNHARARQRGGRERDDDSDDDAFPSPCKRLKTSSPAKQRSAPSPVTASGKANKENADPRRASSSFSNGKFPQQSKAASSSSSQQPGTKKQARKGLLPGQRSITSFLQPIPPVSQDTRGRDPEPAASSHSSSPTKRARPPPPRRPSVSPQKNFKLEQGHGGLRASAGPRSKTPAPAAQPAPLPAESQREMLKTSAAAKHRMRGKGKTREQHQSTASPFASTRTSGETVAEGLEADIASDTQSEPAGNDDAPQGTSWETPPPATWQKNAQGKMHMYRMAMGMTPLEQDDVFTQVPGRPGQQVKRTLERQRNFEEERRRRADAETTAARNAQDTRRRLNGNDVRPLAMTRGLYTPKKTVLPAPRPAAKTTEQDGSETEEESANVETPSSIAPKAFGPADVEAEHRVKRLLGEAGSAFEKKASVQPAAQTAPKDRQSGAAPVVMPPVATDKSAWASHSLLSTQDSDHHTTGQTRKPDTCPNEDTVSQQNASTASLRPVDSPLLPARAESKIVSPQQAPETLISRSLLGYGQLWDDDETYDESQSIAPTSHAFPPRYISSADLNDGCRHLSPRSKMKVYAVETQPGPSSKPFLASVGPAQGFRGRTSTSISGADDDPDRTMVEPPRKTERHSPAKKRKPAGSASLDRSQGKLTDYGMFEAHKHADEQKKRAAEAEKEAVHKAWLHEGHMYGQRCDTAEGKTHDLSDDDYGDDPDITRVGADLDCEVEGSGTNAQKHLDPRSAADPSHSDAIGLVEAHAYGLESQAWDYRDDTESQQLAALKDEDAIRAARRFSDACDADETQLISFGTQDHQNTLPSSGSSVSCDLLITKGYRFERDGVHGVDSEGNSTGETIPLPYTSSLGISSSDGDTDE